MISLFCTRFLSTMKIEKISCDQCCITGGRVVSIGIAPWGIVDRRNELLGKKKEVAFHPVPQPR